MSREFAANVLPNFTLGTAKQALITAGAKNVGLALGAYPHGPVTEVTSRSATGVDYEVRVGTDRASSMAVWSTTVLFGQDDRHCAGGHAFVEAARTQARVAFAIVALLENRDAWLDKQCPPGFFCIHGIKCKGAV